MPVRDDLLQPVSEDAPGGVDLAYDKLFDQVKEARVEDDESLPAGTWSRAPKKADRPLVIRLAGDALATRSKDLRLAGWYAESLLRHEGTVELAALLQLLQRLQEQFWDVLYPLQDEDGDLGHRVGALESAAAQMATQLRHLPVTRSGVNFLSAQDARAVGYEQDATTPAKKELRADALARGRVMVEDLDRAIAETPKIFYAEADAALRSANAALEALAGFHEERYGEDPPSFVRLKSALGDVGQLVAGLLAEKRKTEPDPKPGPDAPNATVEGAEAKGTEPPSPPDPAATMMRAGSEPGTTSMVLTETSMRSMAAGTAQSQTPFAPNSRQMALAQVAESVRFLSRAESSPETAASPDIAYLLAAATGVALVWRGEPEQAWAAPAPGVRQTLRRLAREKSWKAVLRAGLDALAAQPETMWLDLHRYIWQAAVELEERALAAAVMATVRGCLESAPRLASILMDDDTPSAGVETHSWLAALQPATAGEGRPTAGQLSEAVAAALGRGGGSNGHHAGGPKTDRTAEAAQMLKQGRAGEGIGLLSRFAEEQTSGRLRFERRLQTAELCLQAGHAAVAQPLLADLLAELEKRTLEGWEGTDLLGKPLALLIRCIDAGVNSGENRATLFAKLCRLDPMAAAALDRREAGGAG